MQIIKLDATDSTNALLKELWQKESVQDWTVVWAYDQYGGRGQKGTVWQSDAGKNLTFSVLRVNTGLDARLQFILNMVVSLAVYDTLKELGVPETHVKWPNDIMSGRNKICGILIENIVKSKEVRASVIGIGMNINQEDFGDIDRAASLKMITGVKYNLDELLQLVLKHLRTKFEHLEKMEFESIKFKYSSAMYRINQLSTFEFPGGTKQNGIIRGISEVGKLVVELNNATREFDMKEIQLLD